MLSKACAMPRAFISGVPLKSMCSIRWLMPATSSLSSRLPARIHTPRATLVDSSRGSEKTLKPSGSSLFLMLGSLKGLLLQLLEGDAVLLVDVEDPHLYAVALVHDVLDAIDALPARRQAGDVDQAVAARHQLDEGAEVRRLHDLTGVDVAGLYVFGHAVDRREGILHGDAIHPGDEDRAIVLDGDRDAVLFLEGVYRLATRTDEEPDLVRRYLQRLDARRVVGDLGARLRDRLPHNVQDLEPASEEHTSELQSHSDLV